MLTSFFNELQSHKLVLLKGLELALSVALLCACSKLIDPRAIKCLEKTWIYYPALHLRSWELQERKKPQHGFALHWRERKLLRLSDDCGLTLWPQCSACMHANQCTVQLYSNLCHLQRATKFDAKLLA